MAIFEKVRVLKRHPYRGKHYKPGDTYEAHPKFAALIVKVGKAEFVDDEDQEVLTVDVNGVVFNPAFCQGGDDSTKADGTWRKKRNVSVSEFDEWYNAAKEAVSPKPASTATYNRKDMVAAKPE